MDRLQKVTVLRNEIEAQLVDSVLTQEQIPHVLRSYHDLAYDGLFQSSRGWGHVEAPREMHERVMELINELRNEEE